MGAAASKSETYINACVRAGLSVVNNTIASVSSTATQTIDIDFSGCKGLNIGELDLTQLSQMDLSAFSSAVNSTDMDAQLKSAISAAVNSEAKSGLLTIADADGHVETDIVETLTLTIKNECQAIASGGSDQLINFKMTYCENANIGYFNFEQTSQMMLDAIAKSESMSEAISNLVDEVDAASDVKSKGQDITLIILGIVALVLFLVFGGLDFVVKSIFSISFWFLLSLGVTIGAGYFTLAPMFGWKPSKQIKDDDDDATRESKRKYNKKMEEVAGIVTSLGLLATLGTGWVFKIQKGKAKKVKVISQAAPVPPTIN